MIPCGICGEQKKLLCGPCAGYLVLRNRINLIKSLDQLDHLSSNVNATLDDPRTGNLDARIQALEAQLSRTKIATAQCRTRTAQVREQIVECSSQLMTQKTESRQRENAYIHELSLERANLSEKITVLEKTYKQNLHQTLAYQSHCLRDLLAIFIVRRRRRRHGQPPDTLLGFGIVPDGNSLLQYSAPSVNAGLERVASFTTLCAAYLGVQLPYRIVLPSRECLDISMIHCGETVVLKLSRTVRELLRSDPAELYAFCRSFAMLLIDVASLGARLGVPKLGLEDVARLNELITHIVLRLAGQVNAGLEIQVQSAIHVLDLDSLQDHLITQAEVGAHAGWDVVDTPEPSHPTTHN